MRKRDITEHNEAEEPRAHLAAEGARLVEAEAELIRLRRAYDAMACGVHVRDRSRRLVFQNPAAVRILGLSGREVVEAERSGNWTFVDEAERPQPRSVWPASAARRTGKPQHAEIIGLRLANVRTLWLRLDAVPVLDASGKVSEVVISFYDVTKEKLAMTSLRESQERLRASEERYRMIVGTAHEGIWMFDAQGRVIYTNHRMCEITGRREEELLGRMIGEVFDSKHQERFDEAMPQRRLGVREELEIPFNLRDGTQRWAHVSASGVLDDAGNLTGAVGMWTDITERKHVEQALKLSEERYRTIVDTAHEGIWMFDPEGRIVYVNRRACEIAGRAEEQLLGATLGDLLGPIHQQNFKERLPARRRGVREQFEVSFHLNDGTLRWIHISSTGVFDEAGNLTGVVDMWTDITERKRTEEALRVSEERYRAMVETAEEGIWTLDPTGAITFANRRLAAMLDYGPEDLIGKPVALLVSEEDRQACVEHLADRRDASVHRDIRLQRKDGSTVWAMISCSQLVDGEGQISGTLGMLTDISGRKQAEEALIHQALHDSLTGLPNRALLRERLNQAIQMAQRNQAQMALLVLDLDGFKQVNDTLGHSYGDRVLKTIGSRLGGTLRQSDTVARLGGDEFAIVLPSVRDGTDATAVADKISETISVPINVEDYTLNVGASIGIALYPEHGKDDETLLRRADMAMYQAKNGRRSDTLLS